MKKFLLALIVLTTFIVVGCGGGESTIVSTVDNEIKITAKDATDSGGNGHINIPDGSAIHVDAKISAGKLIIRDVRDEGKEFTVDKSGETFIDVPAGECGLRFELDGLTGEIILRAKSKN